MQTSDESGNVFFRYDDDGNVRLHITNVIGATSINRISEDTAADVAVTLIRALPSTALQAAIVRNKFE